MLLLVLFIRTTNHYGRNPRTALDINYFVFYVGLGLAEGGKEGVQPYLVITKTSL